jgi:hypothetical protein
MQVVEYLSAEAEARLKPGYLGPDSIAELAHLVGLPSLEKCPTDIEGSLLDHGFGHLAGLHLIGVGPWVTC